MFTSPSNLVKESGLFIAKHSTDVLIAKEGVHNAALQILKIMEKRRYSVGEGWKMNKLNPQVANEDALEWIFVVDTLNFSFWPDDSSQPFVVAYKDQKYTNYWSLCAAINRALDEGIPITSAEYLATITEEQVKHVFRSETATPIPLLNERVAALREAGAALVEHFDGKFANLVRASSHSAALLMESVLKYMPMYRDESVYKSAKVYFYKRLQILVADIWACFNGKYLGYFSDIDTLTMFADYRVPQTLAYFGVLKYSDRLTKRLENRELFQSGDLHELEIRGCSIWAIELIKQRIQAILKEENLDRSLAPNSILVDYLLWDYAQDYREQMKEVPIHLVRSAFY